jgi:thiol-disulfide isomerase/thioredoxin
MRRSLIPIIIIVGALAASPYLLRTIFPRELPAAQFAVHQAPRQLPQISFSDGLGRSLTLNQFHGSFILLNIWATWCPPCKEEMASLDRLALLLADKNISVVPISIDVSGLVAVRSFYKRQGLNNLSIYVDPSKTVMDALAIVGIPTTLLIDREGREIGRMAGPAAWDAAASMKHISEMTGL